MIDFGESEKWEIEPVEIDRCVAMGHKRSDVPIKNSHANHRVSCDVCGYTCTYVCHVD